MLYTIWCIIVGETTPFSVEIDETEYVGTLKDHIKEAKPSLDAFDASGLTLYKINVNGTDKNRYIKIVQDISQHLSKATELRVFDELSEVFGMTAPPKKRIHILVEPPAATSVPRIPFTSVQDKHVKEGVSKFEIVLRKAFEIFLRDNVQLPLWQPPLDLPDGARRHITGLKIPTISSSSQLPLLLLHNLGQPSHDPQLANRVHRIFRPHRTKFLCNTSGSGKTRLLLEGLSRNWGFYFTACTEPEGVGSSDLEEALRDLKLVLEKITDGYHAPILVLRHSLLLLYARYVCFRIFLECAAANGGITENHKGRWLLIQVAPVTLLAKSDIFIEVTQLAAGASYQYLQKAIRSETKIVEQLLPPLTTLFCVLDEAQVLPKNLDCFQSKEDPAQGEPILREIVHSWRYKVPNLIVSGTAMSMQEVERVVDSVVAKEGGPETVTEIGGFDDEDGRRAYLEQYFPPGFLDTSEGKEIASRVGYWLRGRHGFIAIYLSRLIRTGFQSPHQVLNDLVFGMTGFRPSDWDDDTALTVKFEKPGRFGFESLLEEPDLLSTLADFLLEYTFTGTICGLYGPNGDAMVEYGVSRFKQRAARTDEPLAILGLVTFFEQQQQTLAKYLTRALNTSDVDFQGIALKAFGAYLLAHAFSEPKPLSEIFEFVGTGKKATKAKKALQDELAELVTLEKVGDNFQTTPFKNKTDIRSRHVLGRSPSRRIADTLEWLQNPQGSAFCFPESSVGPDLIFVLRLRSDNTLLRVCVQFRHTQKKNPGTAIRTTDPSAFLSWESIYSDSPTCSDPLMRDKMEEAIKNLGNGTKKAGRCGVLRVVISHPSPLDSNTLEEAAEGGHPLAIVPLSHLEPPDSDLARGILSLAHLALQIPDRKRKSSDEDKLGAPEEAKKRTDTEIGESM